LKARVTLSLACLITAGSAVSVWCGTAWAQTATSPVSQEIEPTRVLAEQVAVAMRQLTDGALDQDARDAAARRLLSIGTSEARNAVLYALKDPGNPAGRLAAARAVADDRPPDSAYIDALFVLLDADTPRPLLDAAAIALGNYKSEPDVALRLIELTRPGRPDAVRIAAVRGLSTQIEKRAAQRLVELAQEPGAGMANAASEALQVFASLPLSAPADWANWWQTQVDHSDERFRLDMLTARATRFEQEARQGDDTFQELRRKVLSEIAAASKEERGEVMARYLLSPRASLRLIAVRQAYDYAITGDLPANCAPILLGMLSDVSEDVRFEAARAIQPLNDPAAFDAIAQQLAVESDARVRAELARSIGPIGNVAAVPLLKWLLDDSSVSVVQSSADALAGLGDAVYAVNPANARDLADKLQSVLQTRGTRSANPRLREKLVRALIPLRQPSLLPTYTAILTAQPAESEVVRGLATRGIGLLGEPATVDLLVDVLRGDDPPAVRIEAIQAIGKVARDFSLADTIYRSMDPAREPDETVRGAAWVVLRSMFEVAPRQQLASWPEQSLIKTDVNKRLAVFEALARKSGTDGAADDQTAYLQQVGDCLMELGSADAKRYAEATGVYQQALAITRQTNSPAKSMRIETLVELTLRSMLRSRDYAGATRFSGELMRDNTNGYQGLVGKEFKLEAERLVNESNQLDDANRLIREALSMTPTLPDQYRVHLQDVQKTVEARMREKNDFGIPDFMHGLAMR
jgi:HEAT repeat protein